MTEAYKKAGVDIDAQDRAIDRIKAHVKSTRTPGVLADVGSFGGLFKPEWDPGHEPILVSSADGVGTKLKVAIAMKDYTTIGADLVNHCLNDILVQGAKPLFYMDYISLGKMDPEIVEGVVKGMTDACRAGGCALLGGEMAEMPGLYKDGDFDIAGFVVGQVNRADLLPRETIGAGDVLLGLPSTGLHTNGYSLAIKTLLDDAKIPLMTRLEGMGDVTVGEALLRVHRAYGPALAPLLTNPALKGLAHITGGGLVDNVPRILPEGLGATIDARAWPIPPIFGHIARRASMAVDEAFRVFNLGIGMVCVVDATEADAIAGAIGESGLDVYRIGAITAGDGTIRLEDTGPDLLDLRETA